MEYRTKDKIHFLTFDKEEMITLLAVINEGAEALHKRSENGDSLTRAKHDAARLLLGKIKEKIMRATPEED